MSSIKNRNVNVKLTKKQNNFEKIISMVIIIAFFALGTLGVPSSDQIDDFAKTSSAYYIIGILFFMVVSFTYYKDLFKEIKLYFKNCKKSIGLVFKYFLIAMGVYILTRAISMIALGAINMTPASDAAIYDTFKAFPLYVVFITIIYSPYVEEVIFRKSLGKLFTNKWIFIVLSGLVWGLLHVSIDITSILSISQWNWVGVLESSLLAFPYVCFGGVLAYSYKKTDNIFIPVSVRFLYNIIVTFLALSGA